MVFGYLDLLLWCRSLAQLFLDSIDGNSLEEDCFGLGGLDVDFGCGV